MGPCLASLKKVSFQITFLAAGGILAGRFADDRQVVEGNNGFSAAVVFIFRNVLVC